MEEDKEEEVQEGSPPQNLFLEEEEEEEEFPGKRGDFEHSHHTTCITSSGPSPQRPIGKNSLVKFSKNIGKLANLKDWSKLTNHGWRQYGITLMANSEQVSATESCAAARHKSVTSQVPYMATNTTSEANRQRALSYIPYDF